MAREIERKFLVAGDGWKSAVETHTDIRQAYLATAEKASIRVRIAGEKSFVTIKSAGAGTSRHEFEYPIPHEDAETMLEMRSGRLIEKRRHIVPHDGCRWEVDAFAGEFAGLVIAEIELSAESHDFDKPAWLGREITGDQRYYNAHLAEHGPPSG
jgi:adenylate cyclase